MNPVTALSWLWKALRGHSVTFAALLAAGLLGVSVLHWFRASLGAIGAPWLAVLVVPMIVVAVVAKRERDWLPEVERRKRWSRGLLVGGIVGAVLLRVFGPEQPLSQERSEGPARPVRPRGPSGK